MSPPGTSSDGETEEYLPSLWRGRAHPVEMFSNGWIKQELLIQLVGTCERSYPAGMASLVGEWEEQLWEGSMSSMGKTTQDPEPRTQVAKCWLSKTSDMWPRRRMRQCFICRIEDVLCIWIWHNAFGCTQFTPSSGVARGVLRGLEHPPLIWTQGLC